MNKSNKGFIVPLLLVIIAVLVIGGGAYIYSQKKAEVPVTNTDVGTSQPTPTLAPTATPTPSSSDTSVNKGNIKIYSISQASGPVGIGLILKGNFSEKDYGGPEYATQIVMVGANGEKAVVELMPNNDAVAFTVQSEMCTRSMGGSGAPCNSPISITPGVYSIYYENVYLKERSNSVTFQVTAPAAGISVAGMKQYTDTAFGFSFWYPSDWTVQQSSVPDSLITDGTMTKKLIVSGGQYPGEGIAIEEFVSNGTSIKDNSNCGPADGCPFALQYYFDSITHTWMRADYGYQGAGVVSTYPANTSVNSMGGLHIFQGNARFGDDVIIPLSAKHFVVIRNVSAGTNQVSYLAKTVMALDATVATPWTPALQVQTIQAEANAYTLK